MISLLDLSAEFWRIFYAEKGDAMAAYTKTHERLGYLMGLCEKSAVLCDSPRGIRYEWAPDYKGNRVGAKPVEAVEALKSIKDDLAAQNQIVLECDGYEADDLMATIVRQSWPEDVQLVTQDKDLYQLIDDNCWLWGRGGALVREPECVAKFGVKPKQIRDWLALAGDAADNVKGCPGIGKTRAADLLNRFGTIAGIQSASDGDLLTVKGVGLKGLASIREWDPTLAVKLVSLLDDAPLRIEDFW